MSNETRGQCQMKLAIAFPGCSTVGRAIAAEVGILDVGIMDRRGMGLDDNKVSTAESAGGDVGDLGQ